MVTMCSQFVYHMYEAAANTLSLEITKHFADFGGSTQETAIEKKALVSNPIVGVKHSFRCILLE